MRASSIFPILSVILLFMGGLCIAASEFYKTRHNIILSAGIFFVSAGKSCRTRQPEARPTSREEAEVGGPGDWRGLAEKGGERGEGFLDLPTGQVSQKAGCAGLPRHSQA